MKSLYLRKTKSGLDDSSSVEVGEGEGGLNRDHIHFIKTESVGNIVLNCFLNSRQMMCCYCVYVNRAGTKYFNLEDLLTVCPMEP